VNSINWARVMAQIVYYVYAALKLWHEEGAETVHFAVPTGNFGDIFAGYIAKQMLSPLIKRLILATNENNILTRFVVEGRYAKGNVIPTISPSMDIQIASNFERYLFYLYGGDPERVRQAMETFKREGEITFSQDELAIVRGDFASASIDQTETLDTIREIYQETGYVLDPHTAVGVAAAKRLHCNLPGGEMVCLATAHPAKFPAAVRKATGREPERPERLQGLEKLPSRCEVMSPDVNQIKNFIIENGLKEP